LANRDADGTPPIENILPLGWMANTEKQLWEALADDEVKSFVKPASDCWLAKERGFWLRVRGLASFVD
jgi:hypothetical protein